MSGFWFTALCKIWLSVIIKVFTFNTEGGKYTLNTGSLIRVQIERKQTNKSKNHTTPKAPTHSCNGTHL